MVPQALAGQSNEQVVSLPEALEAVSRLFEKLSGRDGKKWLLGFDVFLSLVDPIVGCPPATLNKIEGDLSVRARKALRRLGFSMAEPLFEVAGKITIEDLQEIKNCGSNTVEEIRLRFLSFGIALRRRKSYHRDRLWL